MDNTREKLIELLGEVQYLGGLEEKVADHLIANGVTVPKWIPVSERLPESGKIVLIYQVNGYVSEGSYSTYDKKWRRFRWGSGYIDVTHWMPLPEPPKGE